MIFLHFRSSSLLFSAFLFWAGAGTLPAVTPVLREDGQRLRYGNSRIDLVLEKENGYLVDLVNLETGIHHKVGSDGAWPFRIAIGRAIPLASGAHQVMKYS